MQSIFMVREKASHAFDNLPYFAHCNMPYYTLHSEIDEKVILDTTKCIEYSQRIHLN